MVVKTIAIFNVSVIFICSRERENITDLRNYVNKKKTVKHVIGFLKPEALPCNVYAAVVSTLCNSIVKANKFKLVHCVYACCFTKFSCHFFSSEIECKNHLISFLFCDPLLCGWDYELITFSTLFCFLFEMSQIKRQLYTGKVHINFVVCIVSLLVVFCTRDLHLIE